MFLAICLFLLWYVFKKQLNILITAKSKKKKKVFMVDQKKFIYMYSFRYYLSNYANFAVSIELSFFLSKPFLAREAWQKAFIANYKVFQARRQ